MQDSISDIVEYMPLPFSILELVIFAIVALVVLFLLFKLLVFLLKPKSKSIKEELLELTFSTKEELYKFSKLAKQIDNSKQLKDILKLLEEYKFAKESQELPQELKDRLREYVRDV